MLCLALDGQKRLVRSIASNQGHLLWCGLSSTTRAIHVARRMLANDMFSGFGIRTSRRTTGNTIRSLIRSDAVLAARPECASRSGTGAVRTSRRGGAHREGHARCSGRALRTNCLPELFCGFDRDEGPPVPYEKANVPQAWAATNCHSGRANISRGSYTTQRTAVATFLPGFLSGFRHSSCTAFRSAVASWRFGSRATARKPKSNMPSIQASRSSSKLRRLRCGAHRFVAKPGIASPPRLVAWVPSSRSSIHFPRTSRSRACAGCHDRFGTGSWEAVIAAGSPIARAEVAVAEGIAQGEH